MVGRWPTTFVVGRGPDIKSCANLTVERLGTAYTCPYSRLDFPEVTGHGVHQSKGEAQWRSTRS